MAPRSNDRLLWRLFRYSFSTFFPLRGRKAGQLLALSVLGAVGLKYLYDVYGSVFQALDDPNLALTYVLALLVGLQGLLFYLGFLRLMGVLYSHNELASLLILPLSEHLVVAAFFLPVLMRAYLLEGISAGPALAALFQMGTFSIGQGLRLVGLLLLGPPLALGLALLLLLFLFAHVSGHRRVWAATIAGVLLLLAGAFIRNRNSAGLVLYLMWESAESPLFWVAGVGILALEIGLIGQAISHWWARGREGHVEDHHIPALRRRRKGLCGRGESASVLGLVRREWVGFVSVPAYLTNYLATAFIGIVPQILLAQRPATAETGRLTQVMGSDPFLQALAVGAILLVQGLVSTGSLTAFSRDGQEWWTLRGLPIPLSRFFLAKLIANGLMDLLGILPALLAACFLFPLPSPLRTWWISAVVISLCLETGVKVALDALSPHFGWTEPLQPMRSLKRYVSYLVNAAVIGGCAALATFLQRLSGASAASFLLFLSAIELVGLSLLIALLVWQAGKAEAGRSGMWWRLMDRSAMQ